MDEALWDRVQRRLEANKSRRGGNPGHARMLSGRVFCPLCGAKHGAGLLEDARGREAGILLMHPAIRSPSGRAASGIAATGATGSPTSRPRRRRPSWKPCRRPASIAEAFRAYKQREAGAVRPHPRQPRRRPPRTREAGRRAESHPQQDEAAAVQAQIAGIRAGASPDAYADAFAEIAARRKDLLDRRGILKTAEKSAEREGARPRKGNAGLEKEGIRLENELLAAALRVLTSPEISGSAQAGHPLHDRGEGGLPAGRGARLLPPPAFRRELGEDVADDTFHCIEITGIVGDVIGMQDIFRWDAAQAMLHATGPAPRLRGGFGRAGLVTAPGAIP